MRFEYTIIVATDQVGGFIKEGRIPWNYHEDFLWFKEKTEGRHCIMGRGTFEDIRGRSKTGAVLPGRTPWVVSTTLTPSDVPQNCGLLDSPLQIEEFVSWSQYPIMVLGGKRIYDQMLEHTDTIYLTEVKGDYKCDQFFDVDYVKENFEQVDRVINRHPDLIFYTYKR
jgi:dihydrofolate reductase